MTQLLGPLLPLVEPLLVLGLIAVVLGLFVPKLRSMQIRHLLSFRRFGRAETTTPFHSYGFVVLGLGALGDAAGGYTVLGSTPWFAGALLGALMGLLPQGYREKTAFLLLAVLALCTTV